ncbi:hypothetical protein D3C72_2517640 [compost metagenome]
MYRWVFFNGVMIGTAGHPADQNSLDPLANAGAQPVPAAWFARFWQRLFQCTPRANAHQMGVASFQNCSDRVSLRC